MGREVRRVALDFDWPVGKVWKGFLNPHYVKCAACDGRGHTVDAEWLEAIVHLLLLAGENGTTGRLHPWLAKLDLAPSRPPTPRMALLTTGLAGRSPMGRMGHDSLDRWKATKAILTAAGLEERWGECPECGGDGVDRDHQKAYEAWERTEPPEGPGWQLWETVSEGSPITPVFDTPEALATWCHGHPDLLIGATMSYERWLGFIRDVGWAPSLIMDGSGVRSGVEAATEKNE